MLATMPHAIWLKQVNFLPFTYDASSYSISSHTQVLELALGYISGAGGRGAGVGPAMVGLAGPDAARVRGPTLAAAQPGGRGAGDQRMDDPDRGRDRAAARCADFRGLYQDRSGNPNILPDAARVHRVASADHRHLAYLDHCDLSRSASYRG
jgi:hypothetical protein